VEQEEVHTEEVNQERGRDKMVSPNDYPISFLTNKELEKIKQHILTKAQKYKFENKNVYLKPIIKMRSSNTDVLLAKNRGFIYAYLWNTPAKKGYNYSINLSILNGLLDFGTRYNEEKVRISYEIFPSASAKQPDDFGEQVNDEVSFDDLNGLYNKVIVEINKIFRVFDSFVGSPKIKKKNKPVRVKSSKTKRGVRRSSHRRSKPRRR
jgi:hypothetical protein